MYCHNVFSFLHLIAAYLIKGGFKIGFFYLSAIFLVLQNCHFRFILEGHLSRSWFVHFIWHRFCFVFSFLTLQQMLFLIQSSPIVTRLGTQTALACATPAVEVLSGDKTLNSQRCLAGARQKESSDEPPTPEPMGNHSTN